MDLARLPLDRTRRGAARRVLCERTVCRGEREATLLDRDRLGEASTDSKDAATSVIAAVRMTMLRPKRFDFMA